MLKKQFLTIQDVVEYLSLRLLHYDRGRDNLDQHAVNFLDYDI